MSGDPEIEEIAWFPDPVALHQRHPERYPFLLQSVDPSGSCARFDILFAFPAGVLSLSPDGTVSRDDGDTPQGGFLDALDELWRRRRRRRAYAGALPFGGGWFLYLGYELATRLERRLPHPGAGVGGLDACAVRVPAAIVRDHARHRAWALCERGVTPSAGITLATMRRDAARAGAASAPPRLSLGAGTEEPPERFARGVERIRRYIRDGDVFQVNLSRQWRVPAPQDVDSADIYRQLCERNPAPFAGIAHLPDGTRIISSSPERLVEIRRGVVRTRPIAGTFPRGRSDAEDAASARGLLRHPKERAEHVMLIDLERNDLGRVCRAGSVRVSELMSIESYRHVHHIVSEVCGELREGITPGAAIAAVFPGGTITGCPKVRCMEIIAGLEQGPRGAYTGSMGYLDRSGDLDLNILIRTMVRRDGELTFRAGAGIVWDSVPRREIQETRNKARGLLAALEDDDVPVENAR